MSANAVRGLSSVVMCQDAKQDDLIAIYGGEAYDTNSPAERIKM